MRHNIMIQSPIGVMLCMGLTLTGLAGTVDAEDFFWNNCDTGDFADPANWNDGMGGVPGAEDAAIFDLDCSHTVELWDDHTAGRLLVGNDILELYQSGEPGPRVLSLTAASGGSPGIIVGG